MAVRSAGPVAVTYEAGPTGFGLARALTGGGSIAWWRHRRSCSDRRGTGSRPMPETQLHLARLLRMDQIVTVPVPNGGAGSSPGFGARPRGRTAGI